MNSVKMKKKKQSEKPSLLPWAEVKKLPLRLFHTLRGPIMGHVAHSDSRQVRVYAPAVLGTPLPTNVLFQPVAFVDFYIDLQWCTMFGTSLIPDLVVKGYLGYFEQFAKGNYTMKPVVASIEAPKAEAPEVNVNEARMETCPACNREVSNWQAHYPVLFDPDTAQASWHCEMDTSDIREQYPNYIPPRPQDA